MHGDDMHQPRHITLCCCRCPTTSGPLRGTLYILYINLHNIIIHIHNMYTFMYIYIYMYLIPRYINRRGQGCDQERQRLPRRGVGCVWLRGRARGAPTCPEVVPVTGPTAAGGGAIAMAARLPLRRWAPPVARCTAEAEPADSGGGGGMDGGFVELYRYREDSRQEQVEAGWEWEPRGSQSQELMRGSCDMHGGAGGWAVPSGARDCTAGRDARLSQHFVAEPSCAASNAQHAGKRRDAMCGTSEPRDACMRAGHGGVG